MNNLPVDIIRSLLLYLEYRDILKFSLLSRKYHRLSNEESLWKVCAAREKLPVTFKESFLLHTLGQFEDFNLCIVYNGRKCNILWNTRRSPYNVGALKLDDDGSYIYLEEKYRKYIVFRQTVTLEIPFFKHSIERYELKSITLNPNTPVGSTLEHFFGRLYKEMYNLRKSQIYQDLPIGGTYWSHIYIFPGKTKNSYKIAI